MAKSTQPGSKRATSIAAKPNSAGGPPRPDPHLDPPLAVSPTGPPDPHPHIPLGPQVLTSKPKTSGGPPKVDPHLDPPDQ